MSCSRCGGRKPSRPMNPPSSIRPGSNPTGIVPNPAPTVPGSTRNPRDAITGLRYVPNNGK